MNMNSLFLYNNSVIRPEKNNLGAPLAEVKIVDFE